jgi:hypothetical protein
MITPKKIVKTTPLNSNLQKKTLKPSASLKNFTIKNKFYNQKINPGSNYDSSTNLPDFSTTANSSKNKLMNNIENNNQVSKFKLSSIKEKFPQQKTLTKTYSSKNFSTLSNKLSLKNQYINKEPNNKKNNKKLAVPLNALDIMRKKIEKVLNESNEKIANISVSFSMIDMNSESSYSKVQESYSKELDNIYMEKIEQIKEINEKYDYDLYIFKKTYQDFDDNIVYNSIVEEKKEAISSIENNFLLKKIQAKEKYQKQINEISENTLKQRKALFESEIFEQMKKEITKILNKPIPEEINGNKPNNNLKNSIKINKPKNIKI